MPAWEQLQAMLHDDQLKAVVVIKAPLGTSSLFHELRARRNDLLLVAIQPVEDPLVMQAAADYVIDPDYYQQGVLAVRLAAESGASHLAACLTDEASWATEVLRSTILTAARAANLDLRLLKVPPGSAAGDPAVVPIELQHGRTALFWNDPGIFPALSVLAPQTGKLFMRLMPDRSRPLFSQGVRAVSELMPGGVGGKVLPAGSADTVVIWSLSHANALLQGSLGLVRALLAGSNRPERDLAEILNAGTYAGSWQVRHYPDPLSGVRSKNHLLVASVAIPGFAGLTTQDVMTVPVQELRMVKP
jgi:hypothetical protein